MQVPDLIESIRGRCREIERLNAAQEDAFARLRATLELGNTHTLVADDPWRERDGEVQVQHDGEWFPCDETVHARHPNHGVAVTRGTAMHTGILRYPVETRVVRPLDKEAP